MRQGMEMDQFSIKSDVWGKVLGPKNGGGARKGSGSVWGRE